MRLGWTIRHSWVIWLLWWGIWQAAGAVVSPPLSAPEPSVSVLPVGLHPAQQRRALMERLLQLEQAGDIPALVALVQPAQGLLSYPDSLFDESLRLLLRVQQPTLAWHLWQTRENDLPAYNAGRYDLYWQVLIANGLFAQAQVFAETLAQREPRQVQWQQRLLNHAHQAQQPAVAVPALQRLVQYRGDAGDWLAWLSHPDVVKSPQFLPTLIQLDAHSPLPPSLLAQALSHFKQQPQLATTWLQQRLQRAPEAATAQLLAKWASRYHDPQTALAAWESFAQLAPQSRQSILPRVALLRAQGKSLAAFTLLQDAITQAKPEEVAFWRALGDVAWERGEAQMARRAYRHVAANHSADPQTWQRLSDLLAEDDGVEAAQAATEAWLQSRQSRDFFRAVARFDAAQWQGNAARLWENLSTDEIQRLGQWPAFFAARAQYWQRQGQYARAIADWKIVVARQAHDEKALIGWLWALVEQGQVRELNVALKNRSYLASRYPGLWAAAYLQLQQPRRALPYLRQQVAQSPDPLWQLVYAEALELSGSGAAAWSIRQSVWQQARPEEHPQWRRQALWAQQSASFQRILASYATPPVWRAELLRQWLNSRETNEATKRWLAQRYANTLTRPHWQKLASALADSKTRAWEKALSHLANPANERLLQRERMAAARYVEDISPATTTEASAEWAWSPRTQRILADVITQREGEWHSQQQQVHINLPLSSTTNLQWQYQRRQDQQGDKTANRQRTRLAWQYRNPEQQMTVGWEYDEGRMRQRQGVQAAFAWQQGAWQTGVSIARRVSVSDSIPLALATTQDYARAEMRWTPSLRDQLQGHVQRTRWQWQDGMPLAEQTSWGVQAAHQWHFANPSVRLVAGWTQRQGNNLPNTASPLIPLEWARAVRLPHTGRQWHVGLAWNDPPLVLNQAPWQIQGRVQFNHHSSLGYGGEAQWGLQRRLHSGEQLGVVAFWRQGLDGLAQTTRGLAVQYRYD